jgi:DNA topoisomerase-3
LLIASQNYPGSDKMSGNKKNLNKTLFLAEKPGVARDIAGVLGNFTQKRGYLENDSYIVTWALGHLAELAAPEDYDPSLKKWRADTLPIIPASFFVRPIASKKDHFRIVKSLLNRSDVSEVINACDAGREGEAIFRYIYYLAGCRKPHKRLWLSENTPEAIQRALTRLESGMRYDFLFASAQARARADWLVGMNATRAYTILKGEKRTVGRVQTPTLAILVEREREIRAFVPEIYWELWATFETDEGDTYRGKWFDDIRTRFASREEAVETRSCLKKGGKGEIFSLDKKDVVVTPPPLYSLDYLQQDANRFLGMTAARTLEVAQLLYEKRKLITYPRTDSRFITELLAGTLPGRLTALSEVRAYFQLAGKAAGYPVPAEIVNNAGVTDHHAILPTEVVPDSSLSGDERDIYDLVARRFLAVFFPPAVHVHTSFVTKANDHVFQSRGSHVACQGWEEVYSSVENADDNGQERSKLPALRKGDAVDLVSASVEEKKTRPPGRYTDATLLDAMKNAGRVSGNAEKTGKEAGLGTPATRASIIEKLISVGYVERRGKHLAPTGKGEDLMDLVPEELRSPQMTAEWESLLQKVEQGKYGARSFMAGIEEMVRRVVEAAVNATGA